MKNCIHLGENGCFILPVGSYSVSPYKLNGLCRGIFSWVYWDQKKKKSVFVFISWWWCFGSLRSWRLFFYKLMPYLWWWTSFLYCPVLKNLLILKPENNGSIGMKLCMYAGYNWVEIIYLVCRVWIGTNPYYIISHFEQTYDLLVSTGTRFPFPPWVWGYVWWKLMMMVSVTSNNTLLYQRSLPLLILLLMMFFFLQLDNKVPIQSLVSLNLKICIGNMKKGKSKVKRAADISEHVK